MHISKHKIAEFNIDKCNERGGGLSHMNVKF